MLIQKWLAASNNKRSYNRASKCYNMKNNQALLRKRAFPADALVKF